MTHGLARLTEWFTVDGLPDLTCPACAIGHLQFVKLDTHRSGPSEQAERDQPDDFEPEWVVGRFVCILKCSLNSCGEPVVVVGDFETRETLTAYQHTTSYQGSWYTEALKVTYIHPLLPIVKCPSGTPIAVRTATEGAADILWSDPGGAANRLRAAIEELLTARGVARYFNTKAGKRQRHTTDARIQIFAKKDLETADILMAVKWIGNAGSHEQNLTAAEVLAGAELLSLALHKIYDLSERGLVAQATRINKNRGPIRKKK